MNSEKGQILPLVLVTLAVGTLVIGPFLSHASTGFIVSRVYEQAITEQYSAGAGVEYSIWHLQNGELVVPGFTINNMTVNVTIEDEGEQTYKITSVATSDNGSSTTIESYVSVGDISVVDGDIEIENNAEIEGDVSATGNITLNNNAEIDGNARAEGDITLENNATITGIVYTTGNIELGSNAIIGSDVYIVGDIERVILGDNARIEGNIYITGNITDKLELGDGAEITGDVFATGTINTIVREENILGDVYENYTGEYPPPPEYPELPVAFGIVIQTWEITRQ